MKVSQHESDAARDPLQVGGSSTNPSLSYGEIFSRNELGLLKIEYKFMFVGFSCQIPNKIPPFHAVRYIDIYVYTVRRGLN